MAVTVDRRLSTRITSDPKSLSVTVGRALEMLDVFLGEDHELTLTELARRLDIPKSTAFRLVTQLTQSGYLTRVGRHYRLSLRVLKLGNQHPLCRPKGLREIAAAPLASLYQHTGLVASLAVLDGNEIMYLDRIRGPRVPPTSARVGNHLPALSTALGKAIVSHSDPAVIHQTISAGLVRMTPYSIVAPGLMFEELRRARAAGVAYDREETVVGMTCVAAPILAGRPRTAVAAISVSGPVLRLAPESVSQLVTRAARLISNEMSAAAGPDATWT